MHPFTSPRLGGPGQKPPARGPSSPTIVGAGIQNAPGYAARMFGTLADAGINIEMISTSEIRITTIIAEDRVEEAVRALHAAFELEQPETVETAGAAAG